MDLLSSLKCGQFQVKKESIVADSVLEKGDKRRLSIQGAILRIVQAYVNEPNPVAVISGLMSSYFPLHADSTFL